MTDIEEPDGLLPDDDGFAARIQAGRNKRINAKGGTRIQRTANYIGEHPWRTAGWTAATAVVLTGAAIGVVGGDDEAAPEKNIDGQEQTNPTDPGFNPGGNSGTQGQDQGQTQADGSGDLPGGNPLDSAAEPHTTSTAAPTTVPPVPDAAKIDAVFECDGGFLTGATDPRNSQGDGINRNDLPAAGNACTPANGNHLAISIDGGTALLINAEVPGAVPAPEQGL